MKAKIWNYRKWLNVEHIPLDEIEDSLKIAGFTIVGFLDHAFEPVGYTAIWLLGESHLAYHTFPEANKVYIELSSCNKAMFIKFKELFKGFAA